MSQEEKFSFIEVDDEQNRQISEILVLQKEFEISCQYRKRILLSPLESFTEIDLNLQSAFETLEDRYLFVAEIDLLFGWLSLLRMKREQIQLIYDESGTSVLPSTPIVQELQLLTKSTWFSFIATYSNFFVAGDGRRRFLLKDETDTLCEELVSSFSDADKSTHEEILEFRNNMVAHGSRHKLFNMKMFLIKDALTQECLGIESIPSRIYGPNFSDIEKYYSLMGKISSFGNSQLGKSQSKFLRLMKRIARRAEQNNDHS
jgi:hypothetical protein